MEENYSFFPDNHSTLNQSKSMRPEDDIIELLWQNGHVVLNNQTNRRTTPSVVDPAQLHEVPREYGEHIENSTNLIREDETAKWFQYLLSDSYEKDFSSAFSCGASVSDSMSKMCSDETIGNRYVKFGATEETNAVEDKRMPPPVWQANGAGTGGGLVNFPHFSRSMKGATGDHCLVGRGIENVSWRELGKCSSRMTEVSSSCRRRNSLLENGLSHEVKRQLGNVPNKSHCGKQTGTRDITTTATSSSGGSGSSIGRTVQQSTGDRRSHKRKGRCIEESECQSEEAELQSVNASKLPQNSTSARRSRSAEVHNLSERRRRDRINEKMKALQELVPHCNKTDKASMLDEAIEYLKSLQLQVQMMWMGNGMAPMMFPNIQQYLPSVGMGMGNSSISTLPNTLRMAQALVDQSMSSMNATNQAPALSHATQMHNANIPDAYARCLGFNHMQPPPEAVNLLTSYGSQLQKMLPVNGNQIGESAVPSDNVGNDLTTENLI